MPEKGHIAVLVQPAELLIIVGASGLVRSLRSNLGFQPQNTVVVSTDLNMAGYHGDQVPVMQRRMLDALPESEYEAAMEDGAGQASISIVAANE